MVLICSVSFLHFLGTTEAQCVHPLTAYTPLTPLQTTQDITLPAELITDVKLMMFLLLTSEMFDIL